MIDIRRFSIFSEPLFVVSSLTASELTDVVMRIALDQSSGIAVRTCRGSRMRDTDAMFDEFAAAFQFPYYFGGNWAAFDECMADLSWLPARAYLACITSANEVGVDDDYDSFATLVKTLNDVVKGWAGANPNLVTMDREPRLT